jgi:hypothetical protein
MEEVNEMPLIEEVDHSLSSICPICTLARLKKWWRKRGNKKIVVC